MAPEERERQREANDTSRSEVRAERRRALDRRGRLLEALSAMNANKLARVELEPDLHDAVRRFSAMGKGSALARERRHLVRRLGEMDIDELERRVAVIEGTHGRDARRHRLERTVDELLTEGDTALERYLADHPKADRQRLRQALRAARSEREAGDQTRKRRQLYRLLEEG